MNDAQARDFAPVIEIGSYVVHCEIPPCGLGLGAQDALPVNIAPVRPDRGVPIWGGGGSERISVPNGTPAKVLAAVRRWAKAHPNAILPCPRCKGPAWNRTIFPSLLRNDLCEVCFMADLEIEMAKAQADEDAEVRQHDAKAKSQGCTHKVDAWVHPYDGDDILITLYYQGQPRDSTIQTYLRKRGSQVLTDYKVAAL